MRDSLSIGPVPADESCEQVGPNCDYSKMRAECRAYINQLKRQHPSWIDLAFRIEAEAPAEWDAEARAELKL